MKALGDIVIAKVIVEEKTKGGIVLPQNSQLPQTTGKVISCGEEVKEIKINDMIMFHNRGGQVIFIENEEYRALKYGEIYCVLD